MPNRLIVDQELLLGFSGRIVGKFKNGAGATLNNGDVVIYKTSDATGRSVTTTITANDPKVAGVVIGTAPDSPAYPVLVQMWGPIDTSIVKVNGTTDIAAGDALSTFTTAGIGAKAGANKGGVYAYALEAYALDDSLGKIKVFVTALGASRQDTSAAGNTLDQSYDQGGAGSGRTINATDGAVVIQNTEVDNADNVQIDKSPTAAASGNGLKITMGANATGPALLLANSGTGNDLTGSSVWSVTKAGVAAFAGTTLSGVLSMQGNDAKLNDNAKVVFGTGEDAQIYYDATNLVVKPAVVGTGYVDVNGPVGFTAGTAPAGTVVYAVNDNAGDLTVNALSGKLVNVAIAGTDEFDFNATEFEIKSANNVQFLGDDDIVDSNANELLTVSATAAAVNGWQIKNAATGVAPQFGSNGAGAEANVGFLLVDSNGNEVVIGGSTASAVNELEVRNAATGGNVILNVTGGDVNIGLNLTPKGTGQVNVAPATAGTAANPGLILDGDVNTGLFESAADKLAISTGGTARTEWSVTGQKVGGTADHVTTAGTNSVAIFNGTAPVGTIANGASLYTAVGEMYIIDAGGTATLQS